MLMDLGVKVIFRETFLSSLDLARQTLGGMGYDPARAERSVRLFRDYDEALLKRQQAIYHDEESLITSTQEA
jgi:glutathione-regulated potassium-efflux system protein KefB